MILSVASLTKQKDLGTLIRAFALVHKTNETETLTIVGEGPEEDNLQKMIDDLRLDMSVFLWMPVERNFLAGLYRRCDLFVLPSINEGLDRKSVV